MDRRVVILGAVAFLIAGASAWFAFSSGGGNTPQVSAPGPSTGPSTSVSSTTTTTRAATTTTGRPLNTTVPTRPPPSVVILTPTTRPTSTTSPPPPTPTSTTTVTTSPSTTTTTTAAPDPAIKLRQALLRRLHPSNRGASDATRVVVTYVPADTITVTWAIDTGNGIPPTGPPTCEPPSSLPTTTSVPASSTTTPTATSAPNPATLSTPARARYEAKLILTEIRSRERALALHFKTVRLIGTYPMQGNQEVRVVEVLYSRAAVTSLTFPFPVTFHVPPAQELVCINPAF